MARACTLSCSACREFKMVTADFPVPGTSWVTAAIQLNGLCERGCMDDDPLAKCPPRAPTPDPPATIPFAPTREKVIHLKNYLLEVFKKSDFLRCRYQPLEGMDREPMRIFLKQGAQLHNVRAFRPIPIPFHFKQLSRKAYSRTLGWV